MIRISEIFGPTIQGEGALIGKPTIFVRTGGCDYRCSWCDTLHAVDSKFRNTWQPMTPDDILLRINELSGGKAILITLSGGNPATQDLSELITLGKKQGHQFSIETQGSIAQDWFRNLDYLTLSPKGPSSQMETNFTKLDSCIAKAGHDTKISLKVIILNKEDYLYAKDIEQRYPDIPLFLQPCNEQTNENQTIDHNILNEKLLWILDLMNQDQWFTPTLLPQLHVTLWGNMKGV